MHNTHRIVFANKLRAIPVDKFQLDTNKKIITH